MSRAAVPEAGEILRPYVPRLLIRWLAEAEHARFRTLDGSMLFVDISGFTKMSERLARHGKVGAEEVADALGAVFSRLLAIAYGEDGSLLKFGGDALLLWFSGEGHAVRAATSADGMRATLRSVGRLDTTAGKIVLRMSGGVHTGSFHFFLVGSSHRELVVTGPAASQTVLMESTATAGQILVSSGTAAMLPAATLGGHRGEGLLLRRPPSSLSFPKDTSEIPLSRIDIATAIPPALRAHLLSGASEPEHRSTIVAFVHFDGVDQLLATKGPDVVASSLHELVSCVQETVEANGVAFLGTDIDHDGGKIILTAGAPTALGDDEGRMLLSLRAIVDAGTALPVRIGVNRGHVFAGDIGPAYRRTYTVMGDAVNLAARVMSMAVSGQILTTGSVLEASSVAFNAVALEPFMVKGKRDPVHAYMVGHATGTKAEQVRYELPLVGREDEMATFRQRMIDLRAGRGSLVEVVGGAGMGKTRLLTEFRAEAPDLPQLVVGCELYEASVAYLPVRRLFRLLLGQAPEHDAAVLSRRLEDDVRHRAPDLEPWLPLLAIVADVDVPMTRDVADLGEEFRRTKLEEVVGEYLARVLTQPTLIVIEDAHWMDEASADLLRAIAPRIGELPWLVCVSRREEDTGFVAPEAPRVVAMRLSPLDEEALEQLIHAATEDEPFPRHEVTALTDRSGGNPLFLQELVQAARTVGTVEGLPDSIEGMVVAQIDRLSAHERRILRYASVLGVSFDDHLLGALLTNGATFDRSSRERLDPFILDEGSGRYRFRHALMRDVAYEGLPYRRRKELHERAGMALLQVAQPEGEQHAEVLSLHFFLAGDDERAWRYSAIAAERAEAAYANIEASGFLRRAIAVGRRLKVASDELLRLHERLGDVLDRAALYAEAARAFGEARRLNRDDPIVEARLILKQAKIADRSGRPTQSLRWLSRALRLVERDPGPEAMAQRARLSAYYAAVRAGQGRATDAIGWAERAIVEAEAVGELEALANAHYMIAWTKVNRGELGQAERFERALALFEELGNVRRQGDVLSYHGAMAYWEGRWRAAVDLYERGRERSERAGDTEGAAIASLNIAEIWSDQGRLEEAEVPARQAMRVFRASRYPELISGNAAILGRILSRAGRHEEASELLTEALRLAEEAHGSLLQVSALGFAGEDLVRRGDAEGALARVEDAYERGAAIGGPGVYEPMLERVRGAALLLRGDLDAAEGALDRALAAARASGSEFDVLLALRARRELRLRRRQTARHPEDDEADTIAERLAIVPASDAVAGSSPTGGPPGRRSRSTAR